MDGARHTHVIIDEVGACEASRRQLVVGRPDGSTYTADVPHWLDLGEVLERGETIVADFSG
jgi:hypothetical protein